jgi:hypothetical protein
MRPNRAQIASLGVTLATAAATALLVAPQALHGQGAARPCRIVFDGRTTAGDVLTQRGVIQLTNYMPQADGSLIMMGSGESTATFEARGGCTVESGSPFTERMNAFLVSDDGRTAEIDITSVRVASAEITFRCPGGTAQTRVTIDTPPTITVPLRDGVTVPYEDDFGRGKMTGTLKLEFCGGPTPAQNAPASSSDPPPAAPGPPSESR